MRIEIKNGPAFAVGICHLDPGEAVKGEAGAMVSMTADVDMTTSTQGGVLKGLKRSMLGGESFFMNTFTGGAAGSHVTFAPNLPGDIVHWPLNGQTVYLTSGAYLASSTGVEVDTSWGGAKTFFSSEGLFVLKCGGVGDLLVASYGAIDAVDLEAGETYVVDTGHMVAWSEGVTYEVKKVAGWKATVLGGEGLVCRLSGPGRIYTQTRSQEQLLSWLIPKLPKERS